MSKVETDARPEVDAKPLSLKPQASTEVVAEPHKLIDKGDLVHTKDRFKERDLQTSKWEYPRDKAADPGLVIVFNQKTFSDYRYGSRDGTERDVDEIIVCMTRMGYNVEQDNIYQNLNRDQIIDQIDTITKVLDARDDLQLNSLIVFFLTHGDDYNQLQTYDGVIDVNDLFDKFCRCAKLQGKPKLFVIQACKGPDRSRVAKDPTTKDLRHELVNITRSLQSDILIAFSSTEGNASFRDPKTGTWFIQELCKHFLLYGNREDVCSILTRVAKCISITYYNNPEGQEVEKQMPMFVSTLRKRFYLNTNKHRSLILKVVEEQVRLKEDIRELQTEVAKILTTINTRQATRH